MVGMLRTIAHLPNIKFVGIDMAEFVLRLLLDRIFQITDGFVARNLSPKDAFDVVSENRTVERDDRIHEEGFGLLKYTLLRTHHWGLPFSMQQSANTVHL